MQRNRATGFERAIRRNSHQKGYEDDKMWQHQSALMGSWLPYNPDVCRVLNVVATHKKYDLVQFGISMESGPYEVQIKAMQHSDHEGRGNIRIIDAKTYDAPARSGLHGVGKLFFVCVYFSSPSL